MVILIQHMCYNVALKKRYALKWLVLQCTFNEGMRQREVYYIPLMIGMRRNMFYYNMPLTYVRK